MNAKELGEMPAQAQCHERAQRGEQGLTKREEFARTALLGLCSNPSFIAAADKLIQLGRGPAGGDMAAKAAVAIADATLAELAKDQM